MRPIYELAAEICTLTGHINAANHRWLMLVAEYDRRAAREKVRVARALENLPKVSAAMASAETEDTLLMIAEHGTAQHVEKLVRGFRRCQDAEELSREAQQQQTRCVSFRHDDDGSLILNCRLPAEAGVKILKALELAVEELPVEPPKNSTSNVPAGTFQERVPFSVRRADALALVAESFLAHGRTSACLRRERRRVDRKR